MLQVQDIYDLIMLINKNKTIMYAYLLGTENNMENMFLLPVRKASQEVKHQTVQIL